MAAPALEMRLRGDARQDRGCAALASAEKASFGQAEQSFVAEPALRLAVPRRGHVLSTAAEFYGNPIREAVAALSDSIARSSNMPSGSVLRILHTADNRSEVYRSDSELAAWVIVSIWVTGVATKALSLSASLLEADNWFFGETANRLTPLASARAVVRAENALRARANAMAYLDLLPYVLDPHGPGSRLSVRRDTSTQAARSRKRVEGVFYTPADVADYVAITCIDALKGDAPTVLDPACGTGVFLRAAFRALRCRYPARDIVSLATESLFGTDIDPWALDATAFVLLSDVLTTSSSSFQQPVAVWQKLRRNLACIDTLQIDPDGVQQSSRYPNADGRTSISLLFPALGRGPSIILGNPPYANLGKRSDLAALGNIFRTIAVKPLPSAEIYLAFIEQMIRLADEQHCTGALVLPLSIACNIGQQFIAARQLIAGTSGQWRFAFFDREPHALFGEDVKTRNAILLWSRSSQDDSAKLATGPLRKWRGDTRAAMFKSLRFTPIEMDVRGGIPKVASTSQAEALKSLSIRWDRLDRAVDHIGRCPLADSRHADDRTVFVGPTAYNFLNVFLKPPRTVLRKDAVLSEHPLHVITCLSRQDALAVFALLSSHLTYWWWHAHGDGFHVSGRLLSEFPFGIDAISGAQGKALSELGEELWSTINSSPIVSLNRGRTSFAFTPNGHGQMRRRIDQVLADLAGLQPAFIDELQQFTAHTVAATLRI